MSQVKQQENVTRPGEMLVRFLITDVQERLTELEKQVEQGRIGLRYRRYRLRWLKKDYEHLEQVARRWGFKV